MPLQIRMPNCVAIANGPFLMSQAKAGHRIESEAGVCKKWWGLRFYHLHCSLTLLNLLFDLLPWWPHIMSVPREWSTCMSNYGSSTNGHVTWRPDDRKEMQTAVVWSCLLFIRSGQNHLASHSERGKKTRQTKEEVGRQHQGMDRLGVQQVPEGSGEQGKMEKTGAKSSVVPRRPSPLRDWWWWWWLVACTV